MLRIATILAAAAFAGLATAQALPISGPAPVVTAHARTVLLAERTAISPGETLWLALSQTLDPGWHVYWKNPGDSGLPLDLRWRLPEGFAAGAVLYPLPEQIRIGPLANFGHYGEPTFLISVRAPADAKIGEIANIDLKATWLICEEICVPEDGAFSLQIPVAAGSGPDPSGAPAIAAAREGLPLEAAAGSLFEASAKGLVLEAAASDAAFNSAFFFPETEGLIEPAAAQSVTIEGQRIRIATQPGFSYEPAKLQELKGVLVFDGANGVRTGVEIDAARAAASMIALPSPREGVNSGDLPRLLLAAFFGGLILNVMPCVFPILFIKAALLAKGKGASAAAMRREGAYYAAGVVATFAALGGILLALRSGGQALGWGFHLQSPTVVLLSSYVLFLVGLNLAGVFQLGASLQGIGAGVAAKGGGTGAFATGALAVLVAAPCIGPLLSAPMGAAVLLAPASGMMIFMALAVGFAAPFAALSFFPRLGSFLPRPGRWMDLFKRLLAFPVFAGAAFFLWVLTEQTGTPGLARALSGALLLGLAAFLFEQGKGDGRRFMAVRVAASLIAIGAIGATVNLKFVEDANAKDLRYGALSAAPFDESEIARLRSQGRGVFVDFTAAWCVTCQVNKMTVLSNKSLARTFAEHDVALMSADWTRRDPTVTKALTSFGANGVPLYVYFPPVGEPRVLAQPLRAREIRDVLKS